MSPVNGIAAAGVSAPAAAVVIAPGQTEALTQAQNNTESLELAISRDPAIVLAEASKAAAALKQVIDGKPRPVKFNNETYLEFEDWQTVGRFYGITSRVRSVRLVEIGDIRGFEATADALHAGTGQVISTAISMCLNEERNWANKPLFQLMSMSETRACAKVLRNVLSWVVVLAGYRPTPAEEMQGVPGFQQESAIDIGDNPQNSRLAAQYVAQQKIAEMKKRKAANANPDPQPKPWKTHAEFLLLIELLRERVGETRYNEELDLAGIESPRDFMTRQDVKGALAFHNRLALIAEAEGRMQ